MTAQSPFKHPKGLLMKKRRKAAFEPKAFLAKAGDGKTIAKYQKDQVVFSHGNARRPAWNPIAVLARKSTARISHLFLTNGPPQTLVIQKY
jgi:hypothetical protein